jgi:hypothetical protein
MAIISTKLDNVIEGLRIVVVQQRDIQTCIDRMAYIPGDVATIETDVINLKTGVASMRTAQDGQIEDLRASMKTNNIFDRVAIVIAAAIAAVIGTRT